MYKGISIFGRKTSDQHKPAPLPANYHVSVKGVSVKWFIELVTIKNAGMKEKLDAGESTSDLLPLIKAMTKDHNEVSVVDYLVKTNPSAVNGKAHAFLSHAWKYKLASLIESFKHMLEKNKGEDMFIWFDLLCVNQHKAGKNEYPQEFWKKSFHDAINDIGRTIVLMAPWDNPMNLKRSWCLWEIYGSTLHSDTKIEIVIVPSERKAFREKLRTKVKEMVGELGEIDATKAEAYKKDEQEMILKAAQEAKGGIAMVQESVVAPLREWMTDEAVAVIADLDREITDGDTSEETKRTMADMCNKVGVLLYEQGKTALALNHYRRSLALFQDLYKDELHASCAEVRSNLGALLKWKEDFDGAKEHMMKALEITEALAKGQGNSTLATMLDNYGALLQETGLKADCKEAIKYHEKAIKMEENLPKPSKERLSTMLSNLGLAYMALEDGEAALEYVEKARELDLEFYGKDTKNTHIATDLFNLGDVYRFLGKYDDAIKHLNTSLAMDRKILGHNHKKVVGTVCKLAEVFRDKGMSAEAEAKFREALAIAELCCEDTDAEKIEALENLGSLYLHKNSRESRDCCGFYELAMKLRVDRGIGPRNALEKLYSTLSTLNMRTKANELQARFEQMIKKREQEEAAALATEDSVAAPSADASASSA